MFISLLLLKGFARNVVGMDVGMQAVEPLMMSLDFLNSMIMMVGDDVGGDE